MNDKAKKKQRAQIMIIAALSLGGGGFGFAIGKMMKVKSGDLPFGPVAFIAILIGLMLAVILVHEMGHVIGGWISGYKLRLFTAGPIRLEHTGQGMSLRFNRTPALWGGLAALSPPAHIRKDLAQLRLTMLIMVSAGPAASLLSGLALIPAWLLRTSNPGWSNVFGIFGFLSLSIALATLIPQRVGGYNSDGWRILDLVRNSPGAARWCALAALGANSYVERPRDWPADLVHAVTQVRDESPDTISAAWMRHTWHLDRREIEEAEEWLNYALENLHNWPPSSQSVIHANAAYFFARHRHDAAKAREHLQQMKHADLLPPETRMLAEAAVLQAEGQCAQALTIAKEGRDRNSHKGSIVGTAIDEYFADIQRLALS